MIPAVQCGLLSQTFFLVHFDAVVNDQREPIAKPNVGQRWAINNNGNNVLSATLVVDPSGETQSIGLFRVSRNAGELTMLLMEPAHVRTITTS